MTPLHALAIVIVGAAAGMINTVVGSGSLLTFPTLLALGYPAVLANVSNTVGLVTGSISGAIGYRRELAGQRGRLIRLLPAAVVGGGVGAALLLTLPPHVFRDVVPALILVAVALVIAQPVVAARRRSRRTGRTPPGPVLQGGVFATAVYGGYFGAAQGVILLALLGITLDDDLQRLNAVKNVLAAAVNATAAVVFMATTRVEWAVAGLLVVGATAGGQLGAVVGRRLPAGLLRLLIVLVGTAVAIQLIVDG